MGNNESQTHISIYSKERFEEVAGSFFVILTFREALLTVLSTKRKDYFSLNSREIEIITLLKEGPQTRKEIMRNLTVTLTDRAFQLELAKLKSLGLIRLEVKSRSNIWHLITT